MIEMNPIIEIVEEGVRYICDSITGEVLECKAVFRVDSVDKATWLLERLSEQDASLAALDARKKAILDNLSVMESRTKSKRNALLFKFQPELEQVARENLEKGKKSWLCEFGSVQFRTQPARLKVADPTVALEWAKLNAPETIKLTEEFQISKLTAEDRECLIEHVPSGFEVSPECETVTIKTGI